MLDIIHIGDEPFKISYMDFDADRYEDMLEEKIAKVVEKLPNAIKRQLNHIDIIRSPVRYFRQRCRFAISHRENFSTTNGSTSLCDSAIQDACLDEDILAKCSKISSAATANNEVLPVEVDGVTEAHLAYTLWENGGPNVDVDSFPIASRIIYDTMPIILTYLQTVPELHTDLRAINFLSTLSGDLIATLVYECKLDCLWEVKAIEMHGRLGSTPFCCSLRKAA
jgi:tRNA (Uracil-5-)-methyltransferase